MMRNFLLLPLFLIPPTIQASTVVKNATYDDIQTLGNIPLGTYDSLIYNGFNVTRARANVEAGAGVNPASTPNCAITSAHTSGGLASITVASPYKSLKLLDFYYGCTLHQAAGPAANGAPVDCTVAVTGFLQGTYGEVLPVSFQFSPPEGLMLPIPMNHAVLPARFQQPLFNVTLTQSNNLAVLLMDDLRYSVST